jgi:hypothetical protein
MKFGTVFDRPLNLLEKTYDLQIDVLFRLEDAEFELSEGYIMVIKFNMLFTINKILFL